VDAAAVRLSGEDLLVGGIAIERMDKQALRERIWDELEESGEARFPYPP
jgi:hypothetical protein